MQEFVVPVCTTQTVRGSYATLYTYKKDLSLKYVGPTPEEGKQSEAVSSLEGTGPRIKKSMCSSLTYLRVKKG
jgi:hypothetical protein